MWHFFIFLFFPRVLFLPFPDKNTSLKFEYSKNYAKNLAYSTIYLFFLTVQKKIGHRNILWRETLPFTSHFFQVFWNCQNLIFWIHLDRFHIVFKDFFVIFVIFLYSLRNVAEIRCFWNNLAFLVNWLNIFSIRWYFTSNSIL